MMTISLTDIQHAQARIAPYLTPTMVEPAFGLGANVWLKLENTNRTHSFKIRGALNAALSLDDDASKRGLVTASSGNHAQGLAYAAHLAGVQARILMPAHTPQRKIDGVQRYGGAYVKALTDYADYDAAEAAALQMAADEGLVFVSAYNHPHIIAGTGTIGLEILAQRPDVARVVVCVGGGGLISGVALAVKSHKPDCEVIGVCALAAPTMYNLLHGTDHAENWHTLAEALSGGIEDGALTPDLVRRYVDNLLLVDESHIADAIRWGVDSAGWLIEGGGAVGVAALLAGLLPNDGRETVVIISGGNIDGLTLRRVLATS